MATYRAAYYNGTVLTTQQEFSLPEGALVAAALAEARRADIVGSEHPRVSEQDLLAGLHVGEWTDRDAGFAAIDVAVTADNLDAVRAVVPECLRDEVAAGETVTIRTGLRGPYDAVVTWPDECRGAAVADDEAEWGDVEGGYLTLDVEDGDAAVVIDAATGGDVSDEPAEIEVEIDETGIREMEGCDTDEAVAAVVEGVRGALAEHYPDADVEVGTHRDGGGNTYAVTDRSGHERDPYESREDVGLVVERAVERTVGDGLWADAA